MGVQGFKTTKYHAIAGECIMYLWGVANICFKKLPILEKIVGMVHKFTLLSL